MDDAKILGRINELAREEHELFERESQPNVSDADRERLRQIQVTLDQCWDLLRQRRARHAGRRLRRLRGSRDRCGAARRLDPTVNPTLPARPTPLASAKILTTRGHSVPWRRTVGAGLHRCGASRSTRVAERTKFSEGAWI